MSWPEAWKSPRFRFIFILAGTMLLVCGGVAPVIFEYVEHRPGIQLSDVVLNLIPAWNVSGWIFSIIYVLILFSIISLAQSPRHLLTGIIGYVILTIFRFTTILLFPLEAPLKIIELRDPIVDHLFYQQTITKDLFFSGHTSILFLLGLVNPRPAIRAILFLGSLIIGLLVLVQHAHYTIDVVLAPGFAWLAFWLVLKFLKKNGLPSV